MRPLPARLLREPVVILRGKPAQDRYGSRLSFDDPDRITTVGFLQPGKAAERVGGRDTQSADAVVVLPAGTDVTGRDRLEIGGHTWHALGPPTRAVRAGQPGVHHIEVELRYVET
jgi:hypothetical protein